MRDAQYLSLRYVSFRVAFRISIATDQGQKGSFEPGSNQRHQDVNHMTMSPLQSCALPTELSKAFRVT